MFRALVVDKDAAGATSAGVQELSDDRLPDGDVTVAVEYSTINYKDGLVLDVREGSEYEGGHIVNSKHIPGDKLEDRIQELEKFKSNPIVIIHRSGANSTGKAGSILSKHGFAHVHNLAGGIDTWQKANLPIVKK